MQETSTSTLCAIMRLARDISESRVAQVFVYYSGHVDNIAVVVYPAGTSYIADDYVEPLYSEDARLKTGGPFLPAEPDRLESIRRTLADIWATGRVPERSKDSEAAA